jgi:hypothetical protein
VTGIAQRLLSLPAIQFLSATVPKLNNTMHIPHKDAVMRQVKKICLLPERGFRLFATGYVEHRAAQP